MQISTHTLTWSVTSLNISASTDFQISTHTLTWSVTKKYIEHCYNIGDFNSHAHVERDL